MTANSQKILKEALTLPLKERASLVDDLLASLDQPDKQIDSLWRKEVEERITAYQAGKIRAVTLDEVLSKYRK
ncbi:MAG: addiction module protein [Candidatus Brocadia sp.]|jgi:putative addiction module component (TIGR02574 family)